MLKMWLTHFIPWPLAGVGLSVAAPGRKRTKRTERTRTARTAPRNKLRVGSCHGRTVAGWERWTKGRSSHGSLWISWHVIPVVCLKMGYIMEIFKSCYSGKWWLTSWFRISNFQTNPYISWFGGEWFREMVTWIWWKACLHCSLIVCCRLVGIAASDAFKIVNVSFK